MELTDNRIRQEMDAPSHSPWARGWFAAGPQPDAGRGASTTTQREWARGRGAAGLAGTRDAVPAVEWSRSEETLVWPQRDRIRRALDGKGR